MIVQNRLKLFIMLVLASSCVTEKGEVAVKLPGAKTYKENQIYNASISNVQIQNDQLIITGNNLNIITQIKTENADKSFVHQFVIETKTQNQIVAKSSSPITIAANAFLKLIISNSYGATTFDISFNLCDSSLNGKALDCSVTAQDKDVLSYDAVSQTWKPRAVNGLNYLGSFDASSGTAPTAQPSGSYYIISVAGTISGINFDVGDWIVSNGSAYQKIDNSTSITSVFGRTGAITALEGDYSLDHLLDVEIPAGPIAAGKILKYDGTKWTLGDDLSGGGAGSVSSTEITDGAVSTVDIANLAVTNAKINDVAASKITGSLNATQIANGIITNSHISATAGIEYSKLLINAGDIPQDRVNGLSTSLSSLVEDLLVDNVTNKAPSQNIVFDQLNNKADKTNVTQTITALALTGLGAPVSTSDAANKQYVDTQRDSRVAKTGDSMSGDLSLDTNLRLKGGANYVSLRANAGTSNYTLSLPTSAGTSGYVLSTDGAGILSWVNPSTVTTGAGTVNSASITDDSIVDADINSSANIAQSKIQNLTTDLSTINTTLTNIENGTSNNQWTHNTGNIYRNTGSVSIGTTTPTAKLTLNLGVVGSANTTTLGQHISADAQTSSAFLGTKYSLNNSTANYNGFVRAVRTAGTTYIGLEIGSESNHGIRFLTNGNDDAAEKMRISAAGSVGIGTTSPQSKLDVAGSVRVGSDATGCSGANAGAMKFNSPNIEYCNGTSWVAFSTTAASTVTSTQITDDSIVDADVKSNANITVTKLGTGVVDNTEFNYLNGVTSAIQTQLNAKQALDTGLTNLATFNTNGLLVQTTDNTFVGRSIAGTANRITVTNPLGTAGDPTLNIDTNLLPSPTGAGQWLKSTAANTSAWTNLVSADITTALGFTPISKAGDTLSSGNFIFNGTAIVTIPTPTNLTDAVNKQYVDTQVSSASNQWTHAAGNVYRSTGNVGIGTTNPQYNLDIQSTTSSLALTRSVNSAASPDIFFQKDRGTVGAPAIITSGDSLGHIGFRGYDGANYIRGARISAFATATPTASSGTITSDLVLYTNDNTADASERLRIKANGNIGIGTANARKRLEILSGAANGQSGVSAIFGLKSSWTANDYERIGIGGNALDSIYTGSGWALGLRSTPGGSADADLSQSIERLRIDTNGNIGIGTSSPASLLHSHSAGTADNYFQITGMNTGATSADGFRIGVGSASEAALVNRENTNMVFWNNNSEKMRLTAAGALGVGTNNPTGKLEVDLTDNTEQASIAILDPTTGVNTVNTPITKIANRWYATETANISFWRKGSSNDGGAISFRTTPNTTAPVDRLYIESNGNVGIGTTTPGSKLQVTGTSQATALGLKYLMNLTDDTAFGSTVGGGLMFSGKYNTGGTTGAFGLIYGGKENATEDNTAGYLALGTVPHNGAVTERVRITSTGNVGIGTTNPTYKFQVDAAASLFQSTTSDNHIIIKSGGTNSGHSYLHLLDATDDGFELGYKGDTDLFYINSDKYSSSNGAEFVVTAAGAVGINTTSPQSILHMANGAPYITYEETDTTQKFFTGVDGSGWWIRQGTTANADILTVKPTNVIGINNTTPAQALDVTGNIRASGCVYYNGGSVGTCVSDQRLKKDVKKYHKGLETLLGLRPVNFKYRGLAGFSDDGKVQLGFIADEVEKVDPSLVVKTLVQLYEHDRTKTEVKAVDYGAITYVIINSIQDLYHQYIMPLFESDKVQNREIASLKKENEKLKRDNEEMKKRLDRIEKALSK